MLTFVGLGLGDEKDITLKGYEAVKNADYVFAEFYTSKLTGINVKNLENFLKKEIKLLPREEVENGKRIIDAALKGDVVFLVAGDPMIATTHISLRIMAEEKGIKTNIIHNASIVTAAPGLLGLQNYKFGRTVSLPFPQDNYFPTSSYDFIAQNYYSGLHTLILLDINPEPMTANEAIKLLLRIENIKNKNLFNENTLMAVIARAGSSNPLVRADYLHKLIYESFGPPLHSLVLPGKLHFTEAEALVKLAGAPREILTQP